MQSVYISAGPKRKLAVTAVQDKAGIDEKLAKNIGPLLAFIDDLTDSQLDTLLEDIWDEFIPQRLQARWEAVCAEKGMPPRKHTAFETCILCHIAQK